MLQQSRHQMDPTWQSSLGREWGGGWGGLEKASSSECVEAVILRCSLRSCQPVHFLKAMDEVTGGDHLGK